MNEKAIQPVVHAGNYHQDTSRISKSGLDKIRQSPAHYHATYLDPERVRQESPDLTIGDVFHTAVLEPHKFFERYVLPSQKIDRRYKDGKEAYQAIMNAANGRQFINLEIYERAMRMRDAVFAHPIARQLFAAGIAERICLFRDDETGAPCKCRPDWETPDGLLVDLKSTPDASEGAFTKSVKKFYYYVQDPFYRDGIYQERGSYPEAFIFVACEKRPPYNVATYALDERDCQVGREMYRQDLLTWLECKRTNTWKGYSERVQTIKVF